MLDGYLCSITDTCAGQLVCDGPVALAMLRSGDESLVMGQRKSVDRTMNRHRLRWLECVLRLRSNHTGHRALFSYNVLDRTRRRAGQQIIWFSEMKKLTCVLSLVRRIQLPGCHLSIFSGTHVSTLLNQFLWSPFVSVGVL